MEAFKFHSLLSNCKDTNVGDVVKSGEAQASKIAQGCQLKYRQIRQFITIWMQLVLRPARILQRDTHNQNRHLEASSMSELA